MCYFVQDGALMRNYRSPDIPVTDEWIVYKQIVVPTKCRSEILELAHSLPISDHLSVPRLWMESYSTSIGGGQSFVKTCHVCQMDQNVKPAPLKPVPAFGEPFSRVKIDCVVPMP